MGYLLLAGALTYIHAMQHHIAHLKASLHHELHAHTHPVEYREDQRAVAIKQRKRLHLIGHI